MPLDAGLLEEEPPGDELPEEEPPDPELPDPDLPVATEPLPGFSLAPALSPLEPPAPELPGAFLESRLSVR